MTSRPARLASVLVKTRPVHHQISSYFHQLTPFLRLARAYRKRSSPALNLRGTLHPSADACSRLPMTSRLARLASVLVKTRPVHHQISSPLLLASIYRKCSGPVLNLRGTLHPNADARSKLPKNSSSWRITSELLLTLLFLHHNHIPPVSQKKKHCNYLST